MNVVKEAAKTKEEALNKVLVELNAQQSEIIYSFNEIKGGFLKGITYECSGFLKSELIDCALDFVKNIIKGMGIQANIEVRNDENTITMKIYSSNNPLLIGKNGQNLDALSTLVRQYISNITFNGPRIILDVEDYRDKQIQRLEKLAKNLARDVIKTKIDVSMDNMNSYERRIVHSALVSFKNIKTESVGEEPNRHVVIKYQD